MIRKGSIIVVILMIIAGTLVMAAHRVDEKFENVPLREVLQILKDKYHFKIAYADKYVRDIHITAVLQNLDAHDTFERLLEQTPLTFEIVEAQTIILKRKRIEDDGAETLFELSGVVSDVSSGERLPHAYVWVEPENTGIATNAEGYFSIPVESNVTKLRISYLGYQDMLVKISDENRERRLQVRLHPQLTELEEIVVSDSDIHPHDFNIERQAGKYTVNPVVAQQTPSTGEVDVFRALQLLPGINASNEVSSGLNINGGTSNQNLILFDGFSVYHMDHFFGYFSAFNPLAIKSVQLYKIGFGAKYGGRVSSVVDITGKDGNRNKTSGSIGLNLLSINTSLEVPLSDNGTTLFFSGRRSYTDIWGSSLFDNIFSIFENNLTEQSKTNDPMAPFMKSIESKVVPDFYYTDLNLKLSSRLGLKNHMSFSFYNSNDLLNYTETVKANFMDTLLINTENLGFISWGNFGSSLKLSRQWTNKHYTSALFSYSFYESNFDENAVTKTIYDASGSYTTATNQSQHNNIEDMTFNVDHEWEINPHSRIETGLASSLYSTHLKYEVDDSLLVDQLNEKQLLVAHYVQGTISPVDRLTLTPGLRASYLSATGQFYFDPRFSFSYQLADRWLLKGATGFYHQFISQSNTKNVLEGSRDFWVLANGREIPVQTAWHGVIGIEYAHNQYTFSFNGFQKSFDGLLEYTFKQGNLLTEFDNNRQVFASGQGIARGAEVMVKRDFGRFSSWISYTYNQIRYKVPEINQGRSYYADHDQRHEFNWYGIYTYKNWEFTAVWIYGSGKPYSEIAGLVMPGAEGPGPVDRLRIEEKNGARLPAYHRLDISAKYKFHLGRTESQLAVSVFNVYNHQNILDKQVDVIAPNQPSGPPGRKSGPLITTTDVSLMGITPNVSLRISF